jgi:hypothetical protein
MKLLLQEINYGDGFNSENDIFDRKKLSLQLESIIKNSEDDSLVLALDDQWGSGKTTFLKLWENEIITRGDFEVIYFDAFKNDYQEDAFLALSSAIYPSITDENDKRDYINAAKGVGKFLLKTSMKVGLRAATLGLVKETDFEDSGELLAESIQQPIEKIIEEKLLNVENEVKIIHHFKETITKIAKDKKIIFILDELDRASPDFSLDLLEKIKHVFNTERLHFVLAVNKLQFLETIKKRYGNIDADTYLSKFVHFWFALPQVRNEIGDLKTTDKFVKYLSNKMMIDSKCDAAIDALSKILEANNASLRDCERCFSTLLLVIASGIQKEDCYQFAAAILVFLKIKKPNTFNKYRLGKCTIDDVINQLNISDIKDVDSDFLYAIIKSDFLTREELITIQGHGERALFDHARRPIRAMKRVLPNFESIIS